MVTESPVQSSLNETIISTATLSPGEALRVKLAPMLNRPYTLTEVLFRAGRQYNRVMMQVDEQTGELSLRLIKNMGRDLYFTDHIFISQQLQRSGDAHVAQFIRRELEHLEFKNKEAKVPNGQ